MTKKILITGAAGFIGFHLSNYLAEQGYTLLLIDNFIRGENDRYFQKLINRANVEFYNLDLSDKEQLVSIKRQYDWVFHLAAINGTKNFYEIPDQVLKNDILSTINILELMVETKSKKIFFTSSSETHSGLLEISNDAPIPTPEDVPLVIVDPFNPRWSYAGSKIAEELLVINYSKIHKFDFVIARYYNQFGPREGFDHVIPSFILKLINKIDPFVINGAKDTRSFCYVADGVRAAVELMKREECKNQIFNIGNDEREIVIEDLAELMFNLFNHRPKNSVIRPSPKGSVKRRYPDMTKLRKYMDFKPEYSLEEGLKLTYRWYKDKK